MKQQKQEWEVILGRVKEQEAKEAAARMVQSARPSAIEAAAIQAVRDYAVLQGCMNQAGVDIITKNWGALVDAVRAAGQL